MTTHYCRPIVATLHTYTTVAQSQVTLWVCFGTEALRFQFLFQLQFFLFDVRGR